MLLLLDPLVLNQHMCADMEGVKVELRNEKAMYVRHCQCHVVYRFVKDDILEFISILTTAKPENL